MLLFQSGHQKKLKHWSTLRFGRENKELKEEIMKIFNEELKYETDF